MELFKLFLEVAIVWQKRLPITKTQRIKKNEEETLKKEEAAQILRKTLCQNMSK